MRHVFKVAAVMAALGLPLMVTGCGFVPLYAQQGLSGTMAQIEIDVPQTRTGFFLEQDLRNSFGEDLNSPKAYTLTVTLKEQHFKVGYKVDETSTKSEISNAVTYILRDKATQQILYRGMFTDTVTYDTSKSPLTGVISQQEGQQRSASSISEKIQAELALYFHDRPAS